MYLSGFHLHLSSVTVQNCWGTVEPLHDLLRRTYGNIKRNHLSVPPPIGLNISINDMNDPGIESGLVQSWLWF